MKPLKLVPDHTNIDFLRLRHWATGLSVLLVVASLALVGVRGLNFGIDFTGGQMVGVTFAQPVAIEKLRADVTEALKGKTKQQWVELLNAATVSCGPINTIRDLETDPHVIARGMIRQIEHPTHGPIRFAASPFRMSATPVSYRVAPPDVGEQTDEVLADLLDLDTAATSALRRRGII